MDCNTWIAIVKWIAIVIMDCNSKHGLQYMDYMDTWNTCNTWNRWNTWIHGLQYMDAIHGLQNMDCNSKTWNALLGRDNLLGSCHKDNCLPFGPIEASSRSL